MLFLKKREKFIIIKECIVKRFLQGLFCVVFMSRIIFPTPNIGLNSFFINSAVGSNPSDLAITPNGQYVYVTNIADNTVSVVSTATNKVVQTISDSSFNQPYTVSINPAGTKAYVTNSAPTATTVSVISIATNMVIAVISGFNGGPSGMAITPNGLFGYVNNYGNPHNFAQRGATVQKVNLTTNTVVASISVGNYPAAVTMHPSGNYVYVANYNTGTVGADTVSVIQTTTDTVIATISGLFGPYQIAINPAGTYAYVTNYGNNFNAGQYGTTVSVIDVNPASGTFNTIVDTIVVGTQPSGIAINPAGTYAYVTLYNNDVGNGSFKVIQLSNNTVIDPTFTLGSGPAEIIVSPNGANAYIVNYNDNSLEALSLSFFNFTAQGCMFENIFLTQSDLIDQLTWDVAGSNIPIKYVIYRDAALTEVVGTIESRTHVYLDHNRVPGVQYVYYIIGLNAAGWSSFPVMISVTQNC